MTYTVSPVYRGQSGAMGDVRCCYNPKLFRSSLQGLPETNKSPMPHGIQVVEDEYLPEHLVLMSNGTSMILYNLKDGSATYIPKLEMPKWGIGE
jgi:hypothetical protein